VIPVRLGPGKLLVPTLVDGATPPSSGGKTGRAQSPAGSTPSPLTHNGTSFSVKWIAVAKRGV
jgi:hypothetical protein